MKKCSIKAFYVNHSLLLTYINDVNVWFVDYVLTSVSIDNQDLIQTFLASQIRCCYSSFHDKSTLSLIGTYY